MGDVRNERPRVVVAEVLKGWTKDEDMMGSSRTGQPKRQNADRSPNREARGTLVGS